MSKLTLFFLLVFDGSGYLSGEDERGGVLVGDGGGGGYLPGEDARGGSDNERIFLLFRQEEE